jgi:hypothetical protein
MLREFKNRSYTVNLLSYGRFVKTLGEYPTFSSAKKAILRKWKPEYGDWSIELLGPDGERMKRFWDESVERPGVSRKPRRGRGLGPGKGKGPYRGTGLGPGTGQCTKESLWSEGLRAVSEFARRVGLVSEARGDAYRIVFKGSGPERLNTSQTFTKLQAARAFAKKSSLEVDRIERFDKGSRAWRPIERERR